MATSMTQKALNGLEFAFTQFLKSTSGIRFLVNAEQLAGSYGIRQVKGFDVEKLGKTAKLMDSMCYIPKFVASVEALVVSISQYDSAKKVESVTKIFFASIKVVGDGAASMKFFVAMGMTFYLGDAKLSYIKNVCSVVSTVKFFYDGSQGKSGSGADVFIWEVTARICTGWLNGMGALDRYVGKEAFDEAGKTQIPGAMWPIVGMLASVATAVKECKKG
jgi:hypothetical protein